MKLAQTGRGKGDWVQGCHVRKMSLNGCASAGMWGLNLWGFGAHSVGGCFEKCCAHSDRLWQPFWAWWPHSITSFPPHCILCSCLENNAECYKGYSADEWTNSTSQRWELDTVNDHKEKAIREVMIFKTSSIYVSILFFTLTNMFC